MKREYFVESVPYYFISKVFPSLPRPLTLDILLSQLFNYLMQSWALSNDSILNECLQPFNITLSNFSQIDSKNSEKFPSKWEVALISTHLTYVDICVVKLLLEVFGFITEGDFKKRSTILLSIQKTFFLFRSQLCFQGREDIGQPKEIDTVFSLFLNSKANYSKKLFINLSQECDFQLQFNRLVKQQSLAKSLAEEKNNNDKIESDKIFSRFEAVRKECQAQRANQKIRSQKKKLNPENILPNFDKFSEKKANILGVQRESDDLNKTFVEKIKNKDKRVGLLSLIAKEKRKSEEKFTLAPKSP